MAMPQSLNRTTRHGAPRSACTSPLVLCPGTILEKSRVPSACSAFVPAIAALYAVELFIAVAIFDGAPIGLTPKMLDLGHSFTWRSRDRAAPCIALAQFGLEDLAVIVLRQRVDEDIILRPLEARDGCQAEGVQFGGPCGADDVGDDQFTPLGVRPADDGDFAH